MQAFVLLLSWQGDQRVSMFSEYRDGNRNPFLLALNPDQPRPDHDFVRDLGKETWPEVAAGTQFRTRREDTGDYVTFVVGKWMAGTGWGTQPPNTVDCDGRMHGHHYYACGELYKTNSSERIIGVHHFQGYGSDSPTAAARGGDKPAFSSFFKWPLVDGQHQCYGACWWYSRETKTAWGSQIITSRITLWRRKPPDTTTPTSKAPATTTTITPPTTTPTAAALTAAAPTTTASTGNAPLKKIGGAMAKVGDDTGPGCSAQGFVCDFAEISKMGDYQPKDFIWKVVDPTQRYSRDGYTQQTLNCQVRITYPHATGSTAIYGGGKDWFFVPMGQANVGSTDYCDIEAIRRDFKDSELYMNDTIHIRGETARLNNQQESHYDLIGEFFDLICGCMTELSTEASLAYGLKQHSSALLTVMTSTGTRRELGVELLLYSDEKLANKVEFPQTFPDNSQRFYFLARHLADNDWDAKLQINKCIACSISDDCSTAADSGKRVIFYEQCSTILGGPQERLVHPGSWYNDKTVSSAYKRTVNGAEQWADADPDTCPYAALGLQKFRLAQRETMQVTCAVTACETLPCAPCSARRQLLAGRALQAANAVDVTMFMSLGQGSTEDAKELETEEQKSEQKKKRGTMFIVMIVLVALLALGAILTVRHITKKNKAANEARSVKPLEA